MRCLTIGHPRRACHRVVDPNDVPEDVHGMNARYYNLNSVIEKKDNFELAFDHR